MSTNDVKRPDRGPPSPAEVEPGELFRRLSELPRPYKVVPFPRRDLDDEPIGQVAIWPLTQQELMQCAAAADDFAKKTMREKPAHGEENRAYEDLYKNGQTVEVLCRALRRAGTGEDMKQRAFPSPALMRKTLTADEVSVLATMYLQVQRELGPIVSLMTAEEMDAWLRRLAEGGARHPLALLDLELVEDLLMHSARRLYPSSTDIISSGSPPSDGSPTDAEQPTFEDNVERPPPAEGAVDDVTHE